MNPRVETLTPAQRSRIASIEVLPTDISRPYVVLGQVDGLSCNRNKSQVADVTYDEAMQGIRIRAALLEADAVINLFCQKNSDTDWRNNCWASIKCIGDAVRYK
jgi:hypothetical protein